ncbi:FAD-dependent oxidoreductase [Bacteroidota bacterium]
MELNYLFSPLETPRLKLKNRIVMLGTTLHYPQDGSVDDRTFEFLVARARGGAGLIIVGGIAVDEYAGTKGHLRIDNDALIPSYKRLAEAMHQHGAKAVAQLFHAGRYALLEDLQPRAPSAVAAAHYSRNIPKEMTREDIKETIEHFAQGARRAKEAGLDGVELMCSQGYLINQFTSPASNQRTDEYGGSLENRLRFPMEIIQRVKEEAGDDFAIMMRLCVEEFVPDSLGLKESLPIAKAFEKAGVDILDLQMAWHESRVPSVYMTVPRGAFAYLADAVKKEIRIPVIAVNRINDPLLAEDILRQRKADLIGMCRPLIADPELPNKAAQDRFDDICLCTGCLQGCLDWKGTERVPVNCLVNPEAGREEELIIKPAQKRKKVVVVGGGPAGLETARVLALRGHEATLYEKEAKLGGNLRLAGMVPGKSEFDYFIAYLVRQVEKLGVKVICGKKATPEIIKEENPNAVVIATGWKQRNPSIPGIDNKKVVGFQEVLERKVSLGREVVVIGAGGVGSETALFAAKEGASRPESIVFLLGTGAITGEEAVSLNRGNRKVTVLRRRGSICGGIPRQVRWVILQELRHLGVNMLTELDYEKITDDGLTIMQDGERKLIPADTIVIAAGGEPDDDLYRALEGTVAEIYRIGNAKEVRNCLAAIYEGAEIGRAI